MKHLVYDHDGSGLRPGVTDPEGDYVSYRYDDDGRPWKVAPVVLLLLGILAAAAGPARAGPEGPGLGLIRFTSERSSVTVGGRLRSECLTVLSAEVTPPTAGVPVKFGIVAGTGRGRTAPAMLSSRTAETDEGGVARTVLISSDAEEACGVRASVEGSGPLEVLVRFGKAVQENAAVAPARPEGLPVRMLDDRMRFIASQLSDPSVEVRTAAKRALLAAGRDSVSVLVEVAADTGRPPDVRSLAVRTLAEMRDEDADEALVSLLDHPLPEVRAGTESALSEMPPERARDVARSALEVSSGLARAGAVRILARLREKEATALVGRAALSDPDPFVRATAVWELARGAAGGGGTGLVLLGALRDVSPFVRAAAVKAVVLLGVSEAPVGAEVRSQLSRVLKGFVTSLLASARNDREEQAVRAAAFRALGALGELDSALVKLAASDPDTRARRSAAFGLTWGRDLAASLRLLRVFSGDEDPVVREIALRTIAERGGRAEVDVVMGMLGSGLRPPKHGGAEAGLSSPDKGLRELALRNLRRITCLDFGCKRARTRAEKEEVLARWRSWWRENATRTREDWLRAALDLPGSGLKGEAGLELARLLPPESPRGAELLAALREIVLAERGPMKPWPPAGQPSDLQQRHAAFRALVMLRDGWVLDELKQDLEDGGFYVRLSGLRALAGGLKESPGCIASTREQARDEFKRASARLLLRCLKDASASIRREAIAALRRLTGRSFGFFARAPADSRERAARAWGRYLEEWSPAPSP